MKNKVLIKLILPEWNTTFDVFIPVNELVWKVKKLLIRSVGDLLKTTKNTSDGCILMNKITCEIYNNNKTILDTDIRNGTELILIIKN